MRGALPVEQVLKHSARRRRRRDDVVHSVRRGVKECGWVVCLSSQSSFALNNYICMYMTHVCEALIVTMWSRFECFVVYAARVQFTYVYTHTWYMSSYKAQLQIMSISRIYVCIRVYMVMSANHVCDCSTNITVITDMQMVFACVYLYTPRIYSK